MPVTDRIPTNILTKRLVELRGPQPQGAPGANLRPADDGTHALLHAGFWITLGGVLSLIATETFLGGIGIDGPYTNAGWIAVMFALMGIPFGLLLLALGGAKWLRNRRRHSQ